MPKIVKGGSLPFKMTGAGCGKKHYQNGGFLATLEMLLAPLATPSVISAAGLSVVSRKLKSKSKSKKKTTKKKVVKKKVVKKKTTKKKSEKKKIAKRVMRKGKK